MLNGAGAGFERRQAGRAELEALKQDHPVEEVAGRYGIELRRQGRAHVGRCPFHVDGGRPNLYVWPETASWWCFRCCQGGDVFRFIELAENVSFRAALDQLRTNAHGGLTARPTSLRKPVSPPAPAFDERDPEEVMVLQAATTLYHRRLLADPTALAYVQGRGLDAATITSCQLGYAAGDELLAWMRWRCIPLAPAMRVGVLDAAGREVLSGRIVVPELRGHRPLWLIGRLLTDAERIGPAESGEIEPPKYLGLPGSKPLLGLEQASRSATVVVCEGVFDFLTVRGWGCPCVGLMGTHVRPEVLEQLRMFQRVYLVLDQDDGGIQATLRLADQLGQTAIPVALPDGIKDVAELAPLPDGRQVFTTALIEAAGGVVLDALADQLVTR